MLVAPVYPLIGHKSDGYVGECVFADTNGYSQGGTDCLDIWHDGRSSE